MKDTRVGVLGGVFRGIVLIGGLVLFAGITGGMTYGLILIFGLQ